MFDVAMIGLGVGFFAVGMFYTIACNRL